ncbi:MAG: LapA family protein [Proteobacteria bacterium]|nr:LapA family protein [Pseudomonadota bacterium]
MRVLYWIFAGLLAALAGLFALGNRSDITVDFWPVGPAVAMPVFVALVGALYIGFGLGAVIAWLAQGRARKRAREATRRADALARELADLKAAAAKSATSLTPVTPPGPGV